MVVPEKWQLALANLLCSLQWIGGACFYGHHKEAEVISVLSDFVVGSIRTQEVKKDWEGNDGILDTLRLCFL